MQESWSHVDQYITDLLVRPDPALANALDASIAAGLPAIAVSPPQGKLLSLLVAIAGARRVLEIGTLGGYSTIWLARGLGDGGRIVTLELDVDRPRGGRQWISEGQRALGRQASRDPYGCAYIWHLSRASSH